jgi:hypothetical protein
MKSILEQIKEAVIIEYKSYITYDSNMTWDYDFTIFKNKMEKCDSLQDILDVLDKYGFDDPISLIDDSINK